MAAPTGRICTSVDVDEWTELLAAHEDSTPFHEPWFAQAIERYHPDWRAYWIEVRERGRLMAGMPVQCRSRLGLQDWVSGWGGSYGGPVGSDPRALDGAARTFRSASAWRRRRSEIVWSSDSRPSGDWGRWSPLETFVLEVGRFDSFEEFLARGFPKNRRNECNRSTKRGLCVEVDETGSDVGAVWEIYKEQCGRWGSPPVHQGVWEETLSRSARSRLFVARSEAGAVVGGHLCLQLEGELFAWLGTTRRLQGVFPSSLLIREEARWVHRCRLRRLNLGSSMGLGGVRNYKELMGATAVRRWILRERAWWWGRR